MKPRILLLFAGGTIGMIKNQQTGALEPAAKAIDLLQRIPEINDVVSLDVRIVVNIDSSNMAPQHWTMLCDEIIAAYDDYDGFVVAQGTDTMAYSASAISYALSDIGKPVVFTGSLIPLMEPGSDARNNLVYACMTAALDIAEVCIVMSHTILRGNRAKKHHESFVAAFHTPNYPVLGELGRPITLHDWRTPRHDGPLLTHRAQFVDNIAVVRLFPGFHHHLLDQLIDSRVSAVIIEGFGPGNVPFLSHSIIPSISRAVEAGINVIITNQMEHGTTNLSAYDAGLRALAAGAIGSGDMTIEATITKVMWGLAQTDRSLNTLLATDIAGELSENEKTHE